MNKLRGFEFVSAYANHNLTLPERKTSFSAGYDIAAAEEVVALPHQVVLVPTGLKAYMQPDEYLGIHIRSSLATKNKLFLANAQGIIDADYYNNPDNEGHILIAVLNGNNEEVRIAKGTRIAQGIFYKYLLADQESTAPVAAAERIGGFGSTGSK